MLSIINEVVSTGCERQSTIPFQSKLEEEKLMDLYNPSNNWFGEKWKLEVNTVCFVIDKWYNAKWYNA